jgi:hypothetical protein
VDHGRFANKEINSPLVVEGTYFGRQRFEGVEERDGLRMHFAGWKQLRCNYGDSLQDDNYAAVTVTVYKIGQLA